ncbi:MAG: hypothetical protein GWN16_07365 [Calditrichae bacterium]|nr:hypothetical protein [Calditrichia bacterium]
MAQKQILDDSKGTKLWAFDNLRKDVLVRLMNDLSVAQKAGLSDEQCEGVKVMLAQITNTVTAIPDTIVIGRKIWRDFNRFEKVFADWNEIKGNDETTSRQRKKKLDKLRSIRHKLANKIRRNKYILDNQLDLELIKSSYEAVNELVKIAPNTFKELGKALKKYSKVMGWM